MKIDIRSATIDDKEFWFSLDKHISYEEYIKKINLNECYILFADNMPSGILRYNLFWDNTPFCNLLYIKESLQRKGLGRLLMDYFETKMKKSWL